MKEEVSTEVQVMACLISPFVAVVIYGALGLLAKWLWNWVIVSLFHVEPISYWMGVGIVLVLAFVKHLLFGNNK
jgi:hypothetical protein